MGKDKIASPRIVIYGTGTIGGLLAKFAINKGWPIVAAYNRAGPKIGKDLARLAGLDFDLGVVVEDADTADYSRLEADVALISISDRLAANMVAYRRMMQAGINVLCHGAESYYPRFTNPSAADAIDSIAKQYGVAFLGSGIWDSTRFWAGLVAAGPCVEIDSVLHTSLTDTARQGTHLMLTSGTGMDVATYEEKLGRVPGLVGGVYGQVPVAVLEKLGYSITSVTETREPILFDAPYYCAPLDRVLEPGTCIGTRIVIDVETVQGTKGRCEIELRPLREGEDEEMRWSVFGKPIFHMRLRRELSGLASASSLFNRIPDILSAAPGLHDVLSFGPPRASVNA